MTYEHTLTKPVTVWIILFKLRTRSSNSSEYDQGYN